MATLATDAAALAKELDAKYVVAHGCDVNGSKRSLISAFAHVLAGDAKAHRAVLMYSDDMMAEVLDDQDMEAWLNAKAQAL